MKIILKLTVWVYYPRFKNVNKPNKVFTRTIYMSNHASSFMDPLVVVGSQSPIVFFMTRSDIFTPLLKPILWASHMLPIYRKLDGVDTKKKNEEVFKKSSRILNYGRGLIVFSEGFTDNEFIRRLKPIKKGAVRIGFATLEEINWKKDIYLQAVGANYSDPNILGSDCLIANGKPVCLNDYRESYELDPSRTILELTLKMELEMRKQITDIRNEEMAPFHENIMRITRKGMHAIDVDHRFSLIERWEYSRSLANWFNEEKVEENRELMELKSKLENYFSLQIKEGIEETHLYTVLTNQRRPKRSFLYLVGLAPLMIIGLIHCFLPYIFIKRWVEKTFKRKVFWSSVKMLLGFVAIGLFNLPIIVLLTNLFQWPAAIGILYTLIVIPLTGLIAYKWFKVYSNHKKIKELARKDLSEIVLERRSIKEEIERLVPVA